MARAEQMHIPGTEPVEEQRIPEVAEAIDRWLEAKTKQVRASETAKIRHDTLIAELVNRGLERYSYVDEKTGKKRYVVADKTPRAKTVNAPAKKPEREKRWGGSDEPKQDTRVEHRKVSRSLVAQEIGEDPRSRDPFAAVRTAVAAVGANVTLRVGNGKPVKLTGSRARGK